MTSFNDFTEKVTPAFFIFNLNLLYLLWAVKLLIFHSLCLLQVLPHVKEAGYNTIQLMGVIEHKDYFTVGYRVSQPSFLIMFSDQTLITSDLYWVGYIHNIMMSTKRGICSKNSFDLDP